MCLNILTNIYIMYNHFDKADWKEFFLDEICNISSGVRLTKANMVDENITFIGATESNNEITNFVSNTNGSFNKNVLGINYNGSVVESFYNPYSCAFSDDVKRVSFKNEQEQNKYCYLFWLFVKSGCGKSSITLRNYPKMNKLFKVVESFYPIR